ncbi:hypothetical protein [Herbihabitans rhizosphaerae]|uniref:hypothetical protein n=1 Tax=Herbihabitans rhizosphaerae TaxID=1872711 RepID=UPI00102BCF9D|nr:hypothetical protein [Herbihabitans rhizosphaerae]
MAPSRNTGCLARTTIPERRHEPEEKPLLNITKDDPALDRYLRDALKAVHGNSKNGEFRKLTDDVLSGRASLRDAFRSPAFARETHAAGAQAARQLEEMDPAERARLAKLGEQQLAEERDRLAAEQPVEQAPGERGDEPDELPTNWLKRGLGASTTQPEDPPTRPRQRPAPQPSDEDEDLSLRQTWRRKPTK